MEPQFTINELVEVKASGIRLGHKGQVVNLFAGPGIRQLYAVQFPDSCIGYFERLELEKVLSETLATKREGDINLVTGLS